MSRVFEIIHALHPRVTRLDLSAPNEIVARAAARERFDAVRGIREAAARRAATRNARGAAT